MTDIENKTSISMGLDAIFSAHNLAEPTIDHQTTSKSILFVNIQRISPSAFQCREQFDEAALHELSNSIRVHGVIQPLVVREQENSYELIAGERRLRAAQLAGLTEVPVVVCNVDDQTTMAYGVIENIHRKNLAPLEEAASYHRLLDEFKLTHEKVAETVGRSRTVISNMLRLLTLSDEVKFFLRTGQLTVGHARALIVLSRNDQGKIAKEILSKQLTVRQTERLIAELQQPPQQTAHDELSQIQQNKIQNFAKRLTHLLSRRVKITLNKKGKGRVSIPVNSIEDIEHLFSSLSIHREEPEVTHHD